MDEPINIPEELATVLTSTDDTLGGNIRFVGTRVPLEALLDSMTVGRSIEYFLEAYPGVTREQVIAVLKWEQNEIREIFGLKRVG